MRFVNIAVLAISAHPSARLLPLIMRGFDSPDEIAIFSPTVCKQNLIDGRSDAAKVFTAFAPLLVTVAAESALQ